MYVRKISNTSIIYFREISITVYFRKISSTIYFRKISSTTTVAQGIALPNVTLINPFYIGGSYEGYLYVCLGCHNLHLHYKSLSNLPFFVSREYKNTLFYFKCEIKNKQPFENM